MKDKKRTILTVALVLSLVVNLVFLALHAIGAQEKSITGTFASFGGKAVEGETYLAVEPDGSFRCWKPVPAGWRSTSSIPVTGP